MGAPFPLGSSVNYWQWAGARVHGLYRVDRSQVQPGDIVVMGEHGDPNQGAGADGHTGIVAIVHLKNGRVDELTCIESRGHVGVCLKTRDIRDWDGFIRVVGLTAEMFASELEWRAMYDAKTGTVMHVTYWAGNGRGVIGDGNGVDCSGAVKLCTDYGFDHAGATPVTPPLPPPVLYRLLLEEDDDMSQYAAGPILWPQETNGDGSLHSAWVEKSGELGHRFENKVAWGKDSISDKVHAAAFLFPQKPLLYVAPNGALVVGAMGVDGVMNFYTPDGHGGWIAQLADV